MKSLCHENGFLSVHSFNENCIPFYTFQEGNVFMKQALCAFYDSSKSFHPILNRSPIWTLFQYFSDLLTLLDTVPFIKPYRNPVYKCTGLR